MSGFNADNIKLYNRVYQLHLELTIMTDLLDFELHPEVRLCLQSQTLTLQGSNQPTM